MEKVLELIQLSKTIRGRKIVQDVTLSLKPGEILGFVGPNGSGKTTTIRMIVGLIRPSKGEVLVCGHSVLRQPSQAMAKLGCIVENPELYPWLTGVENLVQFGVMKGVRDPERLADVAQLVGLSRRIGDPVGTYSLGMRQRLGLAVALLSQPRLLVLDEPANGLDPAGIAELRKLLIRLARQEGLAVFLSSHLLSEVQQICDRIAIISQGRLLHVTEPSQEDVQRFHWQVRDTALGGEVLTRMGLVWSQAKGQLAAALPAHRLAEVNRELAMAGAGVELVQPGELPVEKLFLELTGGDEIA